MTTVTTVSSFAFLEHLAVITCGAELFYQTYQKNLLCQSACLESLEKVFGISLESECIPATSCFCVMNSTLTAAATLAVGFPLFPEHLPRQPCGTGAVDFGIGGFIFGTAVVCPEIRGKYMEGSRYYYFTK